MRSNARRLLLGLVLPCALAGSAAAQSVRLGAVVDYGGAYLPSTAEPGLLTGLAYEEDDGPVIRLLARAFSLPVVPHPHYELVGVQWGCLPDGRCGLINEYKRYDPTVADWRQYVDDYAAWVERTGQPGGFSRPAVFRLEAVFPGVGGDAYGGMFQVLARRQRRNWAGIPLLRLSAGVGAGGYVFRERPRSVAVEEAGLIRVRTVEEELRYTFVGVPLRVTAFATPRVAGYLQADLNVLSTLSGEDHSPSPLRAGLQLDLGPALLRIEAIASSISADGVGARAEVAFGR